MCGKNRWFRQAQPPELSHYDKLETTETLKARLKLVFSLSNHYDKLETTEISQLTMDNGQRTMDPEGFREQ
ncbi:MAG: hypothetical protein M0P09_07780 [Acholeplasmataceae bacterium]|nr:hypothetical protein [Acholeplasmataceae bacterium]